MELKEGMYVRTEKGIAKIIDRILEPDHYYFKMWVTDNYLEINYDTEYISEVDVLKASNNIIDLIEVGDYVNGCYVTNRRSELRNIGNGHHKQIGIIKCNAYFNQGNYNDCEFKWIDEEEIKSIVTKEQFESIKYSLEG